MAKITKEMLTIRFDVSKSAEVKTILDESTTVVIIKADGREYKGVSELCDGDIFDEKIGYNIALNRAMDVFAKSEISEASRKNISKEIKKGHKLLRNRENFEIVNGNLLEDFDGDIIAHQVNCRGIMGGGIAKQIKDIYPDTYNTYRNICEESYPIPDALLGQCHVTNEDEFQIANIFGQDSFGRNGTHTNYEALEAGINVLKVHMEMHGLEHVGFPYMIGCGLAGGDTDTVMDMIKEIFKGSKVKVTFYDFN